MTYHKPIKILVIVHQMKCGGLESRLMDLLRNLDYKELEMDIFACCPKPGIFDQEIERMGGKIYYNPELTIKNMFHYVDYFKNFLEQHQEYKIIHAHQNAWCSVFCKGAYLAGVPVRIAHSRTALSSLTIKNMAKNMIKLPARRYATHYFAVSDLAGAWMFGNRNVRNGKVQIWKNAINCRPYRFSPNVREAKREELGVQNKKVIMHVGNFTVPKNQSFLLDILRNLKEIESDCILLLVGSETEAGLEYRAKRKAKECGVSEHVRFLGRRDDVAELLQAADVFCFPSLFEGLPGAVLEAQAAGLPCVISAAITKEVKVLDTTIMLPLKAGAAVWCQEIIKSFDISRRDTFEEMVHAGFDIENLTKELTKFYKTVWREQNAV